MIMSHVYRDHNTKHAVLYCDILKSFYVLIKTKLSVISQEFTVLLMYL